MQPCVTNQTQNREINKLRCSAAQLEHSAYFGKGENRNKQTQGRAPDAVMSQQQLARLRGSKGRLFSLKEIMWGF